MNPWFQNSRLYSTGDFCENLKDIGESNWACKWDLHGPTTTPMGNHPWMMDHLSAHNKGLNTDFNRQPPRKNTLVLSHKSIKFNLRYHPNKQTNGPKNDPNICFQTNIKKKSPPLWTLEDPILLEFSSMFKSSSCLGTFFTNEIGGRHPAILREYSIIF